MRTSLFFRGSVARGTEAAAETRYREQMRADHHPYYGRVVRGRGYVALQYWYFYVFNDWRSRAYGVNDHEFHGLIRVFRRISRTLLPWTRDQEHAGVGIPYVDYARGDGVSIGPGHDREWIPVLIDDQTPWVFDYRGLWGNDTEDRFGGERAPAGPRYERSGTVRSSWGDPVGWSGLAKVAPNRDAAAELVRVRLEELIADDEVVSGEIDHLQSRLRADVASGISITDAEERRLAGRVAHRVELHDERRRLDALLSEPPRPARPHDHLRHRKLPSAQPPAGRRRILAMWSALSTPLILAFVGVAFLPHGSLTVIGSASFAVFAVFAIEAIARSNLVRFLVTLVVLGVLIAVGTTLAGLTVFFGWQTTVAVCLFGLAGLLLVNNLRELSRD